MFWCLEACYHRVVEVQITILNTCHKCLKKKKKQYLRRIPQSSLWTFELSLWTRDSISLTVWIRLPMWSERGHEGPTAPGVRNEFLSWGSFLIPHSLVPLLLPHSLWCSPGSGALPPITSSPLWTVWLSPSVGFGSSSVCMEAWKRNALALSPRIYNAKRIMHFLSYVVFTV